jgi:hypothetical protein
MVKRFQAAKAARNQKPCGLDWHHWQACGRAEVANNFRLQIMVNWTLLSVRAYRVKAHPKPTAKQGREAMAQIDESRKATQTIG